MQTLDQKLAELGWLGLSKNPDDIKALEQIDSPAAADRIILGLTYPKLDKKAYEISSVRNEVHERIRKLEQQTDPIAQLEHEYYLQRLRLLDALQNVLNGDRNHAISKEVYGGPSIADFEAARKFDPENAVLLRKDISGQILTPEEVYAHFTSWGEEFIDASGLKLIWTPAKTSSFNSAKNEVGICIGRELDLAQAFALWHHEVGRHAFAFYNGKKFEIPMIAKGTAGYLDTEEGLANVLEMQSLGYSIQQIIDSLMTGKRAAAIELTHHFTTGAAMTPGEAYTYLESEQSRFGLGQKDIQTILYRMFRMGGLFKEASYYLGTRKVAEFMATATEEEVNSLWHGKFALEQRKLITQLADSKGIEPPDFGYTYHLHRLPELQKGILPTTA